MAQPETAERTISDVLADFEALLGGEFWDEESCHAESDAYLVTLIRHLAKGRDDQERIEKAVSAYLLAPKWYA